MEVIPIFDFGAIGVAQLFVNALLLGQTFVGAGIERDVMAAAGAKSPASRRTVRLVQQNDVSVGAATV
jgi:hypothetical protein